MEFITIANLEKDIISNLSKIPKDIDIVVGIPRSGMLVASIISLQLNLPLTDIDSFLAKKYYGFGTTKTNNNWITNFSQIRKALIVEDSVCHGNSILKFRQKIEAVGFSNVNYIYLAAYVTPEKVNLVDVYFRKVGFPRLFEWNYMHSKFLINACFDIDGVLCDDPTSIQNDDGDNYKNFILNAKCKFKPTFKIGYIVTSRLEKYRNETEMWLNKNCIEYGELIMSSYKTAEERREANDYAKFKSKIYKEKADTFLFVESSVNQAQEIAELTSKSVFCIDNQTYYRGGGFDEKYILAKVKAKSKISHVLFNLISKNKNLYIFIQKLRSKK